MFCSAAQHQHHPPGPESRECPVHHRRLREGGWLWIQHADVKLQQCPGHLLWLAALRSPRALQGWVLPGASGRCLGNGSPAFLHGDRHHAVPCRNHGQAAALRHWRQLHHPPLGARTLSEAHKRHLEAGPQWTICYRPDAGLWLALTCGVPLAVSPFRLNDHPAEPDGLGEHQPGRGSGGGQKLAGEAWLYRRAPAKQSAERQPESCHRGLPHPASPGPEEEGLRLSPSSPRDGERPQEGGAPGLQGPQAHLQVMCAFIIKHCFCTDLFYTNLQQTGTFLNDL